MPGLRYIVLSIFLIFSFTQVSYAAKTNKNTVPNKQFVDGIAAVVNQQVITLGQLNEQMAKVSQQMKLQGIKVPERSVFQHQVLQQMINEELQNQEAKRIGIRVSDGQVQNAIQTIADRNNITVDRLRKEIQSSGMNWQQYQEEIRNQVKDDILRQQFIDERISISDSDIDAFLKTHGDSLTLPAPEPEPDEVRMVPSGPELVELAQILVEVPDYATEAVVQEKRKKAEAILKKLRSGSDFASVAAESSDGPQALQGGEMGIRPLKDWPDLFIKAISKTPPGKISNIIQSGRGFHILKVLRRGYAEPPVAVKVPAKKKPAPPRSPDSIVVTQTHAKHILIKNSAVMTDDKAENILNDLYARINNGESFEELAKRYSEDSSGPKGGDLGWLNPGDTVPSFEKAMDAVAIGSISTPIKSNFGWHIIKVEDRREKNMGDEVKRMLARQQLMERRMGPAYEDWLDQLRAQAYIDNRLEKSKAGSN